jgi:hypothetical protein
MIRCRLHHLEARCRERGYSLEQVQPCIVSEDDGWIVVDEAHPAYPSRAKPGLGDMLKAGLSAVGITEERISRLVGRPCGCGQRAAKINEFGAKYLGLPPGSQNSEATKRDGTQ